jgi:hypothetical protein
MATSITFHEEHLVPLRFWPGGFLLFFAEDVANPAERQVLECEIARRRLREGDEPPIIVELPTFYREAFDRLVDVAVERAREQNRCVENRHARTCPREFSKWRDNRPEKFPYRRATA